MAHSNDLYKWGIDSVRHSQARKLISGILLIALVVVFFSGVPVRAEETCAADSVCSCCADTDCMSVISGSAVGSNHISVNIPSPSECGCSISSAQDTDDIPFVIPDSPHGQDSYALAAVLALGLASVNYPDCNRGYVTYQPIAYKSLYSSSSDGRSPPV